MTERRRGWKALLVATAAGLATVPAASSFDDASVLPPSVSRAPTPVDGEPRRRLHSAPVPQIPAEPDTPSEPGATVVPVLVIPGWSDDETRLAALGARLAAAGWEPGSVLTLSFEDPVGSNRDHAREIALAALALKSRTGAERVDVVAHSMGGLATRYFLQNGGDEHVRRVVFLATPHMGTVSAYFAWGEGAREMEPRSTFLLGLIRAQPVPSGVRAITIRTPLDLHVLPPESATLPGVPNLEVCCPTHAGLLDDDETFELIARFLRDPR
jgi:triacylglycerol esterase/lipase EstA (alpha/beta hydrolase family)